MEKARICLQLKDTIDRGWQKLFDDYSDLPKNFLIFQALQCEHVIKDQCGGLNCFHNYNAPGCCQPRFCPRLNGRNGGSKRKY